MTIYPETHFDVAVVGAGPGGSSCAAMLARDGVTVLLIDKATFPRDKICGDCINPRSWNLFRLLGVENEVAESSQIIERITISSRTGKVLSLSVEKSLGKFPFSLGSPFVAMKRSRLDSILLQRAIRNGATFLQATALESIGGGRNSNEEWLLSLRSVERGSGQNVYCKYLIGADGRNSRVASLLRPIGKRRSEEIEGESGRVGVQFTVARPNTVERSVTMFFFNGGYGGIVGVTAEEANVAMVTTQELSSLAIVDFDRFIDKTIHANKFAREAFSSVVLTGKVSSASPITPRRNRVAHPRAFLVGDARHTAEPFTGQGIFFALQDGVTTARQIADSLGYSSERPKIGTTSHLTVNRFFSPILRGERWVDTLLNIGGRFEGVARMVARSVIS